MAQVITPIGTIHTDFPDKFGIPRQSGLSGSVGVIRFEPDFRNEDCFRGIERYSHLWLLWQFSENIAAGWTPTVRPPRMGGNERLGVFATRSPFRPNGIGLSCVRLLSCDLSQKEGPALYVSGADLMDGTPILDIKPYLRYSDAIPEAAGGVSQGDPPLTVVLPDALAEILPPKKRQPLIDCLRLDPRPAYHTDPNRIYGMRYASFDVHFRVEDGTLYVTDIRPF